MSIRYEESARNVLGGALIPCSPGSAHRLLPQRLLRDRRGGCRLHTVCAVLTAEFPRFSLRVGNDLSTPHAEFDFPGLNPGDRWRLCAPRWKEARDAGAAPRVVLDATHEEVLAITTLGVLKDYAA